MNSIEYQFELKDLANYLILSTFIVPGLGGNYTSLVNELATNNIETALSNFANATMATWDDSQEYKYSDMSVIRTSGLDAFGALWKDFTDRLIDAYTNGGGEVKEHPGQGHGLGAFLRGVVHVISLRSNNASARHSVPAK